MKIIIRDNYDRDYISEILVCENIREAYGRECVIALNNKYSGDSSSDYFVLVENKHKLFEWQP